MSIRVLDDIPHYDSTKAIVERRHDGVYTAHTRDYDSRTGDMSCIKGIPLACDSHAAAIVQAELINNTAFLLAVSVNKDREALLARATEGIAKQLEEGKIYVGQA